MKKIKKRSRDINEGAYRSGGGGEEPPDLRNIQKGRRRRKKCQDIAEGTKKNKNQRTNNAELFKRGASKKCRSSTLACGQGYALNDATDANDAGSPPP